MHFFYCAADVIIDVVLFLRNTLSMQPSQCAKLLLAIRPPRIPSVNFKLRVGLSQLLVVAEGERLQRLVAAARHVSSVVYGLIFWLALMP